MPEDQNDNSHQKNDGENTTSEPLALTDTPPEPLDPSKAVNDLSDEVELENEADFSNLGSTLHPTNQNLKSSSNPGKLSTELNDEELEALLSDSDADVEEIATRKLGYGRDFYKDEDEEDALQDLPEVEREKLLYARSEERHNLVDTLRLRLAQKRKRDEETGKNRRRDEVTGEGRRNKRLLSGESESKSEYSDSSESRDRSRRHKNKDRRIKRRSRSGDDEDNYESDNDSEDFESKSRSRKKLRKRDKEEEMAGKYITADDARAMQITRKMLIKYVDEPFLDQLVGGFVRVVNGYEEDKENGNSDQDQSQKQQQTNKKAKYRMCEIIGFVDLEPGEEYNAEPSLIESKSPGFSSSSLCDKMVKLLFGIQEFSVRFIVVSDKSISDIEFFEWREELRKDDIDFKTLENSKQFLLNMQQNVFGYVYTEEDVKKKVEKKKERRKRQNLVVINYTSEKKELERQVKALESDTAAMMAKNVDENDSKIKENYRRMKELSNELQLLEERHSLSIKERIQNSAITQATGYINARNRSENLKIRERIAKAKEDGFATVNMSGSSADNPYSRQSCRPKTLWATKATSNSGQTNPSSSAEKGNLAKVVIAAANTLSSERKMSESLVLFGNSVKKKDRIKSGLGALHNELKVDLKDATAVESVGIIAREVGSGVRVDQNLKVQPKKFMSLAEYYRRQEEVQETQ